MGRRCSKPVDDHRHGRPTSSIIALTGSSVVLLTGLIHAASVVAPTVVGAVADSSISLR
jgi:hypothetical protein